MNIAGIAIVGVQIDTAFGNATTISPGTFEFELMAFSIGERSYSYNLGAAEITKSQF
jgi:hypothetical protein